VAEVQHHSLVVSPLAQAAQAAADRFQASLKVPAAGMPEDFHQAKVTMVEQLRGLAAAQAAAVQVLLEELAQLAQEEAGFHLQFPAQQHFMQAAVGAARTVLAAQVAREVEARDLQQPTPPVLPEQPTAAVAVAGHGTLVKLAEMAAPASSSSATSAHSAAQAARSLRLVASPSTPSHRPAPSQHKEKT
jgi:hypothetical protein